MKNTSFGHHRFYYKRKYGLNKNPTYLLGGIILTIAVIISKMTGAQPGVPIVVILLLILLIIDINILSKNKSNHEQRLRTSRDIRRKDRHRR